MNPRFRAVRLAAMSALLGFTAMGPVSAAAAAYEWPTYHHDNFRGGSEPYAPAYTGPPGPKWTSVPLGGMIYAEPLQVGNLVIVADISDTVTALDATTGAIVWQRNVGNPVTIPGSGFNCGNISPDGIVGTAVVG